MSFSLLKKTASFLAAMLIALTASQVLAQAAPPGRVARLSLIEGGVSFAPAGSDDWSAAEFNRPLTSGDRLRTAIGARAELHSGSTALRIDSQTTLEISELDDDSTRLTLSRGHLALRVRNLYPGETFEVNTPNLAFTARQPGEYRLDVDPNYGTTGVTVRSGSGVVYGENGASRTLGSQQQARFADRQLAQEVSQPSPSRDSFDLWTYARDRAEDQSLSARYVSRDTIGYQQLDNHGDWRTDTEYGAVWFPRVAVGQWAPYQNGQWRWIAPWGWTWVDNAPWGFAPFHYGRWAQIGAQWAWVPGPMQQRPSYAPALVQFDGYNRFEQDRRVPPQGQWLPLAPGQPWRPSYPIGPRYDNFDRPQRPDWNRSPRPFDNGPTRVEPMVQPPPQAVWPQPAIPHARPEMRLQEAPRSPFELEQRMQLQRQQQTDRERQQQEQNRNQLQQQIQREQMQRQREATQQQMQQQQQQQQQQLQLRDQQNRQQQLREQMQRDAQAQQQQQQDRQRIEQARPMPRPRMQELQSNPAEPYLRPLLPGQRPGDGK